jgi:hypothetical protein
MPGLLPAIVPGRSAVRGDYSGRSIGNGLLEDAVLRSIKAAELIGVHVLLCHAIDNEVDAPCLKYGFVESSLTRGLWRWDRGGSTDTNLRSTN